MKSCSILLVGLLLPLTVQAQVPDWVLAQPTRSPLGRKWHAMAYDSDRKVTVLFAGRDVSINMLADTWEYDGKGWKEIKPPVSPAGRDSHGMVYDSVRKVVVMFGGATWAGTNPYNRDTWTWDGAAWTKVRIPPTQKPSYRYGCRMAFDANRGRTVLFGGYDVAQGMVNDTWEFDGAVWHLVSSATKPPARRDYGLAYDSDRKVVVLFGGQDQSSVLGDTWEWDGVNWVQRTPASTSPSPRFVEKMVYDSHRRRVMIYGGWGSGLFNETWEYSGRDWALIPTANVPPYRDRFGAVFDADRQKTVIFGGNFSSETWEYGGGPCHMSADVTSIPIAVGGAQTLSIDAGPAFSNKPYWIFGSITGTTPGVSLNGIHIPLNLDIYTQLAMQNVTSNPPFRGFRAVLDAAGGATAQFLVPPKVLSAGFSMHHSCVVFDASGRFYCATNPVPLVLR